MRIAFGILKIFIYQLVCKMNWSRHNEKKSASIHEYKICPDKRMRVNTRMTDGKEKGDRRYCHSYSNRLSTDGESEIWYMPSVSMRIDEKDEQCQSQEWNHDECVLRTKINGFGYGRSQILPLKWWWRVCDYDLKREYIPQTEGIVTNKVVIKRLSHHQ